MGNKQDRAREEALFRQLMAEITALRTPAANPAQTFLQNEAMAGGEWLKKGEFSSKPGNIFFDFKLPGENLEQYKKFADVNQGGTFALSDNGGRSQATGIQNKYLKDKFARDASQNYQDNIGRASGTIRDSLAQASGASSSNNSAVINALGGMYQSLLNKPKNPSPFGQIMQSIGQVGSAALSAYGASGGM